MKVIFTWFFFLCVALLIGCGESSTNNSVEAPVGDVEASSENTVSSDNEVKGKSEKITNEIVSKACDCQESAKKTDGTMDFSLMSSCMGGNSSQFVKNLLGPETDDRDLINAVKLLKEKMSVQCPM
jgi:hypothetical protein